MSKSRMPEQIVITGVIGVVSTFGDSPDVFRDAILKVERASHSDTGLKRRGAARYCRHAYGFEPLEVDSADGCVAWTTPGLWPW